jgi:predicted ATPase
MESFAFFELSKWRQFEDVSLDLSSNLCLLTGANGCGKTTILNVLGKHFGWNLQFLTAPFLSKEDKQIYGDAWAAMEEMAPSSNAIGCITYAGGAKSQLSAPTQDQPQYQIHHSNLQRVEGLHIPSHRPPPSYHRIQQIPIDPKTSQQHYQTYQNFLFATYGEHGQPNPTSAMKATLIAFAVFGEGNKSLQPNEEYQKLFRGFEAILAKLLPDNIGFQSIVINTPDVVLKTKSGNFPLESLSGGLNALFSIAWQIHTFGFDKEACTVLLDEPENHLHPSMQREFLPRLSAAFPTYKFIVASHSPFIVASKADAAVYALTYNERHRVVSKRLTEADLTGSPNKVLRDIFDVHVTMPLWVEDRISAVLGKFSKKSINAEVIKEIRDELEEQGLSDALGDYLVQRNDGKNSIEEQ